MNPSPWLTNPYFIAIVSPTALLFCGSLGKAIIKGAKWEALYLGFDASLSAIYAGIVYLYDVARNPALRNENKLELLAGFLIGSFILFLAVVMFHQIWEKDDKKERKIAQFLVLGVVANFIGFGLLVAFVLLVKGV